MVLKEKSASYLIDRIKYLLACSKIPYSAVGSNHTFHHTFPKTKCDLYNKLYKHKEFLGDIYNSIEMRKYTTLLKHIKKNLKLNGYFTTIDRTVIRECFIQFERCLEGAKKQKKRNSKEQEALNKYIQRIKEGIEKETFYNKYSGIGSQDSSSELFDKHIKDLAEKINFKDLSNTIDSYDNGSIDFSDMSDYTSSKSINFDDYKK